MAIRAVESFDIVDFASVCRKSYSYDQAAALGGFITGFNGGGFAMGISNTGVGADHIRRYAMPNFNTATVMFNLRRRRTSNPTPGFDYSSPYFVQFRDELDNVMVNLRLEEDGAVTVRDSGGTILYASTVFVPLSPNGSTDNTNFGHMTLRLSTPTGIEFYIGGVPVFTDFSLGTGALPIRYVCAVHNQSGQDSIDLDNFVCTDTEVWGQTYVVGSIPVADVAISGFFRVGAGTYTPCINESISTEDLAVNYANYIQGSIGGEQAIFRFRNVGAFDSVKAVVLTAYALNLDPDASVLGFIQPVYRRDGTTLLGTAQAAPQRTTDTENPDVKVRGLQFIAETDPFTGSPWLAADINNTYFGVRLSQGPDLGVTRVYQIHREVVCLSLTGGYGASLEDWSIRTPVWTKG